MGDPASELISLGKALKGSDKHIRKATVDTLKRAASQGVQDAVRDEASILPRRGGLAARAAKIRVTPKVRTTGRQAGVKLVGRGPLKSYDAVDRGVLRHPLFGNRQWWYSQSIRPGFWTRPIEERAPRIRVDLARAIGEELHKLSQQ